MRGDGREKEWALLMRAGNAGDANSYRRLLLQLTPVLRAVARRGLSRAGMADTDAEDVVQETLLAIHLKRQSWDEAAPIGPWLRAIARHKMIDTLRRRGRRIDVPLDNFAEVLAGVVGGVRSNSLTSKGDGKGITRRHVRGPRDIRLHARR